jgi:hypothetical protein
MATSEVGRAWSGCGHGTMWQRACRRLSLTVAATKEVRGIRLSGLVHRRPGVHGCGRSPEETLQRTRKLALFNNFLKNGLQMELPHLTI